MIADYEINQKRVEKGRRLSSRVMEHRNGFYVRSESHGAKVYNVKIENGQWVCDCDDFRYRSEKLRMRFDFNCAHILACQYALRYGSVHGTRSILPVHTVGCICPVDIHYLPSREALVDQKESVVCAVMAAIR